MSRWLPSSPKASSDHEHDDKMRKETTPMKLLGKTYLGLLAAAMCLALFSVSRAADDGSASCVSVMGQHQ